jgi:malate permease and related proteins
VTDEIVRVIETIVLLFLVVLTGLFVRKVKLLDRRATERLSNFVVDIAFPALVFTSMLRSVDARKLTESWYLPLLGAGLLVVGGIVGYLVSPFLTRGDQKHRGSVAFAIGTPNWLFIPLPIAIALYGEPGERTVLLVNVGALLVFWSAGVWIVRGGKPDLASWRKLILNPGLLATILGIAVALAVPAARTLEDLDVTEVGIPLAGLSIIVRAAAFIGEVTVPLSMIVTGSLLAGAGARGAWNRHVLAITAVRLAALPAGVMLLLGLADSVGLRIAPDVRTTVVIISAMPIAVTCSIVVEKYGGDVPLVSRAIFVSTLASVLTVPAMVWLMRAIGF